MKQIVSSASRKDCKQYSKFQFVGMIEDVYAPYSKKRINNLSATPKKVALFLDYFIIIEYFLLVGVVTSKWPIIARIYRNAIGYVADGILFFKWFCNQF